MFNKSKLSSVSRREPLKTIWGTLREAEGRVVEEKNLKVSKEFFLTSLRKMFMIFLLVLATTKVI